LYLALFAAALLVLPWVGAERLSIRDILAHLRGARTASGLILFDQRVPRVLLGLAVGGALAVAGASLQVLFRNPLAEPWTLGVAGGASVGAFLSIAFPALWVRLGPLSSTQALALAGAVAVLLLLYALSRRPEGMSAHTLLLAGITVNVLCGGLMMLVTYFVSPDQFVVYHRWVFGGVDVVGYRELGSLLALLVPGLGLLLGRARDYDHLALGEDMALGHGVDVRRTQRLTFVGAGLTTAAAVALTGPIGFVGMMVPHAVRAVSGVQHRAVLPGSFLLGGAVLAACDAAARTALAPTEIPVGIVTAVLGAPLFLRVLTRRRDA
jgi:iron complex transport system permease protein